jgi:hypothetical protein
MASIMQVVLIRLCAACSIIGTLVWVEACDASCFSIRRSHSVSISDQTRSERGCQSDTQSGVHHEPFLRPSLLQLCYYNCACANCNALLLLVEAVSRLQRVLLFRVCRQIPLPSAAAIDALQFALPHLRISSHMHGDGSELANIDHNDMV